MKTLVLCLAVLVAVPVAAQDKKEPSAAQKKQQDRMKACNEKAADKKGDERKAFMSSCLKGDDGKMTAQQSKMATCNKQAADMKGDERKKFMSDCLKKK